jgi:regulatory protein YycI of two-component signal transduction system YycFG
MINNQNRSKVFITIISILLIANIALVYLFFTKKDVDKHEKHPDRKTMIANFLKTEIGFDSLQLQQYDTLSNRHKGNMKEMLDSLRSTKDKQFGQLAAGNFSDSVMNRVADESAASQKMMELRMFNHLKNVRSLCKPAQLPKFDSLFVKVLNKKGGND